MFFDIDFIIRCFQKRFSIRSSDANDTAKWFVRLSYTTDKIKSFNAESVPSIWLDPDVPETTVSVDEDVKWHIFNVQSLGKIKKKQLSNTYAFRCLKITITAVISICLDNYLIT